MPLMLHRKVIACRLSPRLSHTQPVLGRACHKAQLRPLTPQLGMLNLHSPIFHEISVPNGVADSCQPDFFLTPTKTRPFPAAPISPIPSDDDIQLNRRQHATSAEFAFFPSREFRSVWRGRPRPRSYSCDAAASVLVRSGREGTASAVPQPKTFSFLSFRTALAVRRNLLLPRAGCPGLAIFETWETKGSGTLTRRLAEGSLACIFRKIRVSILPSDVP